jgi:hypothetical protein
MVGIYFGNFRQQVRLADTLRKAEQRTLETGARARLYLGFHVRLAGGMLPDENHGHMRLAQAGINIPGNPFGYVSDKTFSAYFPIE